MRAVIQRVLEAAIDINGKRTAEIGPGLLVFAAVKPDDSDEDLGFIASKVANMRVFEDENGKMNLSVQDVGGEVLVVSQFTLYGDLRHGRRPGFSRAGSPSESEPVYDRFIERIKREPIRVETGVFQADMKVHLINDGPVTLLLDSERNF